MAHSRSSGLTGKKIQPQEISSDLWHFAYWRNVPAFRPSIQPNDGNSYLIGENYETEVESSVWSDDDQSNDIQYHEDSEDGSFLDVSPDSDGFGFLPSNHTLEVKEKNENIRLPPLTSLKYSFEDTHQLIGNGEGEMKEDPLTEKLANLRRDLLETQSRSAELKNGNEEENEKTYGASEEIIGEGVTYNISEDAEYGASDLVVDGDGDGDVDGDGDGDDSGRMSRKQFRESIGNEFYKDLVSGQFSYEEIISKYQKMYPEHASKFTRNFCSKVRCGRILVSSKSSMQRSVKNGDPRMKRITKISNRRMWTKMTPKLFSKIYEWEKQHNGHVKQIEIEKTFNVNRSTYYRWKRKLQPSDSQDLSSPPPKEKRCHDN